MPGPCGSIPKCLVIKSGGENWKFAAHEGIGVGSVGHFMRLEKSLRCILTRDTQEFSFGSPAAQAQGGVLYSSLPVQHRRESLFLADPVVGTETKLSILPGRRTLNRAKSVRCHNRNDPHDRWDSCLLSEHILVIRHCLKTPCVFFRNSWIAC